MMMLILLLQLLLLVQLLISLILLLLLLLLLRCTLLRHGRLPVTLPLQPCNNRSWRGRLGPSYLCPLL